MARLVQFIESMGPAVSAMVRENLDSFRPIMIHGIVYLKGRCYQAILRLLARNMRLARLIRIEAYEEDHRANDVLARSRQCAWIIRARYLANEMCKLCQKCKLLKRKLTVSLDFSG